MDWSTSALGSPDGWPEALRIAVAICITSKSPMQVCWGRDLQFHNDAYAELLGLKHQPSAVAHSGHAVPDACRPLIERVFANGDGSIAEDVPVYVDRAVPKEEVFATFSFSPIRGAMGTVDGVLCACTETTPRVIAARRLATLHQLAASQVGHTLHEAYDAISRALAQDREDIPCAALYLCDRASQHAVVRVRLAEGEAGLGATVPDQHRSLSAPDNMSVELAPRYWPEPITQMIALPVRDMSGDQIAVLFCGVGPRRPLDASYQTFLDLLVSHLGTALSQARAKDDDRRRIEAYAELDRAKTQFFRNMSHEFRTPLTLMLGPLEDLLLGSAQLPAEAHEPLELIQRNALRLQKLVNNLLDFSKIETGSAVLSYEPVMLSTLTEEIASTFRSTIEQAGLRFDIECEAIGDTVRVDVLAWDKIVLNLISNAYKHTFDGSITVSLKRVGDHVELAVRDTGVGIDPANRDQIFERFHRIEGPRARSYEGSGIGLALVKELVDRHDGTITHEGTPGGGATFVVRIPLGTAHLRAEETHSSAKTARDPATSHAFVSEATSWSLGASVAQRGHEIDKPHVLVVDDNADMRAYITRLLEHDCVVDAVDSGFAALDIIRRSQPDLVITDMLMPGIDGMSLVREVRANPVTHHVPLIMLAARADHQVRNDVLASGADDLVVKPFSARELRARVRTQLELSAARQQAGNARAASRAKDDFLALFGHELRNPLSAVFMSLQVLQRSAPSPEVELMDRSIRHLTRLVDDLLDLSRLHRGRISLHRRRIELSQVIDLAMERIAAQVDEQQTQVFVSVARTGLMLDCDPERLAQILANVLSNASKYSEPGSKVTVAAERVGDRIKIAVRDQGAGIDPARLFGVFDAFQDRKDNGGLGLGLAIARNLVELHHGTIALNSAGIGHGTECVIELPAEPTQAASPQPNVERKPRRRVLLVEDNDDTAVALKRALETLGYQVALAHNGPVALTVARSFQPDVALVDIGLPVMDGWELANRLREMRVPSRKLHVVAVTARDQDSDQQRSKEAGFVEHLVKPIDLDRLERVVENLPD